MRLSKSLRMSSALSILAMLFLFVVSLEPRAGVQTVTPAGPQNLAVPSTPPPSQCRMDFVMPQGAGAAILTSSSSASSQSESSFEPAAKPHRHGYCRCSCGYACQTSADCGGVSCDPFITCC
jgi:hypothetical protein